MARYFYAIILGLLGAAIFHLAIVFMLPSFSANSSWTFVTSIADPFEPTIVNNDDDDDERNLFLDPLFRTALCRFDLTDGAVRLTAQGNSLFWSLSVFDETGTAYFSANDRIANSPNVDLVIVNQQQLRFARQNTPDELAEAVVAAATSDEGFVLFRVFTPDRSWAQESDAFLATTQCERLEF